MTGGFDARVCVAVFSHGFEVNTSPAQQRLIPELMGANTEGEGAHLLTAGSTGMFAPVIGLFLSEFSSIA